MTDAVIAELHHDPARAGRQFRTSLITGVVSAIVAVVAVVLAATTPRWAVLLVVVAVLFGISALISIPTAFVVRGNSGASIGKITAVGVQPLRFEQPIPWSLISGFTVIRHRNDQNGRGIGPLIVRSMLKAGGVNDGERIINVLVTDPEAVKAIVGPKLEFMVNASPAWDSGTPGVVWHLGVSTTPQQFADFIAVLEREANEHNLTIRYA